MKTILPLSLIVVVSFLLSSHISFAQQSGAEPYMVSSSIYPHDTWVGLEGQFSNQTTFPVTISVKHRELPSGSQVIDTVFTENDPFFSFSVHNLDMGTSFEITTDFSNAAGSGIPWVETFGTTTGVNEVENASLKLFPNPVNDELFIQGAKMGEQVTVSNMLGSTIYSKTIDRATDMIPMGEQPAGYYFVTIAGKTKKVQKK